VRDRASATTVETLRALQRAAGNRAVSSWLERSIGRTPEVPAKRLLQRVEVKWTPPKARDPSTFDISIEPTPGTVTPLEVPKLAPEKGAPDNAQAFWASQGVKFEANVSAHTGWGTFWFGWIQSVVSFNAKLHYQLPDGTERAIKYRLNAPMRDGMNKSVWYEEQGGRDILKPGAKAAMSDEPNIPFSNPYRGGDAPNLQGARLRRVEGKKEFWTWLAVYPSQRNPKGGGYLEPNPDQAPPDRLYHIHWEVDFSGQVWDSVAGLLDDKPHDADTPLSGGATRILAHGPGPSAQAFVLGPRVKDDTVKGKPPSTPRLRSASTGARPRSELLRRPAKLQ
jgi:hypothetical protein